MTIVVGLITHEACVLGCDSIASSSMHLLNPFKLQVNTEDDQSGTFSLEFGLDDLEQYTTNVWSGVTKMFPLTQTELQEYGAVVAAATTGMAKLKNKTIATIASEFREEEGGYLGTVEEVVNSFLEYVRSKYLEHFEDSQTPEQLWDDLRFLVGGIDTDDRTPRLYKLSIKENTADLVFGEGNAGLAWDGQSDAVERLLIGFDRTIASQIEELYENATKEYVQQVHAAVVESLQQVFQDNKVEVPEDLEIDLPEFERPRPSPELGHLDIDFDNMPLQAAVDFASFAVGMQSGRSRFVRGIPTVGGRTRIGVITNDNGFRMLHEPELTHRNIGFVDDF